MDFTYSQKCNAYLQRLRHFMGAYIYPLETSYWEWMKTQSSLSAPWPEFARLKDQARAEGLWNLFLPKEYQPYGAGLTNLEYAPLAEEMGKVLWASEVFNCSAPDTGNMEVLARYGTDAQKEEWLLPLLEGTIRSSYVMTEPAVASSDATNIATTIRERDTHLLINGRKWWITGICDPRCKLLIVFGQSKADGERHERHSIVLVPREAVGVRVVRRLTIFGSENPVNPTGGEAEVELKDVEVPIENYVLGEGRGFEIAQGRLGPGRIHHCMRSIGQAQRMMELMAKRSTERTTFGRRFSERSSIRNDIARSFCEIEQARLLTLKAAARLDEAGNKGARDLIAAIKITAPMMAQRVADRAIQIYGAMGVSDDVPLARMFVVNRFVRIADGPDAVHMSQLGKLKIAEYTT